MKVVLASGEMNPAASSALTFSAEKYPMTESGTTTLYPYAEVLYAASNAASAELVQFCAIIVGERKSHASETA